jgi:hypothetical protein
LITLAKQSLLALVLPLAMADPPPGALLARLSPIQEAEAVVGRPLTPMSAAGVARRSARRTPAATSMYVASLPPSCTTVVIEGTTLRQCGGTDYQASGSQYQVVTVSD